MSKTYFIRWNSSFASQPNEVTPVRGSSSELVLPDDVLKDVVSSGATLAYDPADAIARAVADAVSWNRDNGVYDHLLVDNTVEVGNGN